MNIWTITVTLLLHITPCYFQQNSAWWSGQASPSASQNSRSGTSGNNPGGQAVNPAWNQAPKSWPNTEPSGWSASNKRHVTTKPRNTNVPKRRRNPTSGQGRPAGNNGNRNHNWKPSVFPYSNAKKPPAPPQWSVKSGSSTWRAPGMNSPPKRKTTNAWGRNRTPNVNKGQKPYDLVKGWTSTGAQTLWTDQGNNKNAPPTTTQPKRPERHQLPSWMQKRPANNRQNTGKVYHSNGPRGPSYQRPSPGYTPKPYQQTGYTPKPFPRAGYTPKPYPYPEHTPKSHIRKPGNQEIRPPRNPTNYRPSVRKPKYHRELPKGTRAQSNRRHEERPRFTVPPRSRFDTLNPLPRDPVTDNHRPTRPRARTPAWSEPPSPPMPARAGRFEASPGQSFHRTEQKRVDFNHNDPPKRETAPKREPRRRKVNSRHEVRQSNTVQPQESRRVQSNSRIESTPKDSFKGKEASRNNAVFPKEQPVYTDPVLPSRNRVDTQNEPIPSIEPNRITNTPKMNSDHHTSMPHASSHKDPIPSDTFSHADTKGSNTITKTETNQVSEVTNTEPTHSTVPVPTESIRIDSNTKEKPKSKRGKTRRKEKPKPTLQTKVETSQTTMEPGHVNDLSDKTNTPVPQESVQLAVEVKPIKPTKAVEQQYQRDPITEKIIAELKRKLKILSAPKSEIDKSAGNDSVSVLEVLQQTQLASADTPPSVLPKTQDKSNSRPSDLHHSSAGSPHNTQRKEKTVHQDNGPNQDITEIRHSSTDRHHSEFTRNTDIHHEEIAEPRRTKSRIPGTLDASLPHSNSHPNERIDAHTADHHANVEPIKADIHEIAYYEGVTEVRPKSTSHPDAVRHDPRTARREGRHHRRRGNSKRRRVLSNEHTVEPTIEFVGDPYVDTHKSTRTGRKGPLPDPRPAQIPPRKNRKRTDDTGELISVYNSKTDTFIEPPPNFTPRPKSEADIWGKSQPTQPARPGPSAHELPADHWGPNSHAPDPHMGPPSPYMPAPDPYASPSDPHAQPQPAYHDDGWPGHQPGYQPRTADAYRNQHASVNNDAHMAGQPGYPPEPYHGHPPEPRPYEYQGGPQAPYPPDTYQPPGPPEPYHPAGPQNPYPAVSQPGAYYPDPHQPPPYPDVPPAGPYGPPPTVNSGQIYHTPATIPTTTDDDPPVPTIRNSWFPTPQPPAAQHPPTYHTTPSPLTNFNPYPGPPYAPPPPETRPPPFYDAPQFDQYTIRYPDGSASKEEYTEVTSAVQRIVNYVYDNAMRVYKIADYFVMDRNTDSFAIRIAKDMCYVGTLDSAILDSFTEYTLKTRNATEPVIYSNERLFFFKEIEQVFVNDVNATRGGYIAGSCGDAFIFRVRMVKPRMIHMNDGSILPGSTCPYGAPLKEPRGAVTSCKAGYCQSREHACNPTYHICCPKMPASTRCMSLSIGKFCVTYSANNVIIN
ncbi:proteoglycan 4-like [Pecten maximus]|uniref:proteoglycan 4-like n=1 Tax=Pecten maximus TaxID=6579 RepID=UPI0014590451|nr:proteoglycan 4-like [Pecten maximus]